MLRMKDELAKLGEMSADQLAEEVTGDVGDHRVAGQQFGAVSAFTRRRPPALRGWRNGYFRAGLRATTVIFLQHRYRNGTAYGQPLAPPNLIEINRRKDGGRRRGRGTAPRVVRG